MSQGGQNITIENKCNRADQNLQLYDKCLCVVIMTDREQVEHGADRPDVLLPRGGGEHAGAAGFAGEVREQDPDAHQDRPQLEDAVALPAGRVLHSQGARRPRHAQHGPRAHPAERPPLEQADRRRHHALPLGHVARGRPAHPESLSVRAFLKSYLTSIIFLFFHHEPAVYSFHAQFPVNRLSILLRVIIICSYSKPSKTHCNSIFSLLFIYLHMLSCARHISDNIFNNSVSLFYTYLK